MIAEDERNLDRVVRPARRRAGAGWTACGPTTSTTTCAGRLPATPTATTATSAARPRTSRTRSVAGWFFTGQHSRAPGRARGTRPVGTRLAAVRVLHPESRPGGQPRAGLAAERRRGPAHLPCGDGAAPRRRPRRRCSSWGRNGRRTSPFLYFTDHEPELGRKVTEGRRREFRAFPEFADEESRSRDPRPAGGLDIRGEPVELGGGVARTARRRQAVAPGAACASPAGCAACARRRCDGAGARRGHRGDFQGGDGNTGRHDRSHPAPGQRERAARMAWKAVAGDPGHHGRSGLPAGLARDRDRERSHCPDDYVRPIRRRDSGVVTRERVQGPPTPPLGTVCRNRLGLYLIRNNGDKRLRQGRLLAA